MEELDYQEQQKINESKFMEMLKAARPEIWVLADIVDKTGVNPFVLWKVAYHLNNVAATTKYGNVVVEIENGTVRFVRSNSSDKLNDDLIKVEMIKT